MKRTLQFIFFICLSYPSFSQEVTLLEDLNTGPGNCTKFPADQVIMQLNDLLLFGAASDEHGFELWSYDGNSIALVKDINEGPEGSDVDNIFVLNDNQVIFTADDGVHGTELWVSDGTPGGTNLVVDLKEGSADGPIGGSNYASRDFHVWNNELYFNGNTEGFSRRFFKSDGTAENTVLLAELGGSQRSGEGFTEFNGELYFTVTFEGFWKTDGTPSGTVRIKEFLDDTGSEGFDPEYLTNMGSYLLMVEGYDFDIWTSDGTEEGTTKLRDMEHPFAQNNVGHYFFKKGDDAYFPGNDGVNNTELWKTNGTLAGTMMIADIEVDPGNIPYYPKRRVAFKDKVYYLGGRSDVKSQIYYSDGTEAGTQMMIDFSQLFTFGQVYFQTELIATDSHIFFSAGDPFGYSLWYSDGSASGTYEATSSTGNYKDPIELTIFKDEVFFFAIGDGIGYEPHVMDIEGLPTNIEEILVSDVIIYPNPSSSSIRIDQDELPKAVEIFNFNGMLEKKVEATLDIDVSLLPVGMKTVIITDKSGSKTAGKFMKI